MLGFDLVVANYNNGHFLEPLVESLQAQSFKNWQLFIVDDCSTDNSRSNIQKLVEIDERVSAIFLEVNQGATHAFKVGIESGQQPLVGLIGADDSLPPDSLQVMAEAFSQSSECSLFYSQCLDCDESMNPIGLRNHARPLDSDVPVFCQLYSIFNFLVFPRERYELTEGLNPKLRRAMDHDLILKLDEVGSILYVPKICYHYRNHERGISQGGNGWKASQYSLLARLSAYERREVKPIGKDEYIEMKILYHTRCVTMSQSFSEKNLLHHWWNAFVLSPKAALSWAAFKGLMRPLVRSFKHTKLS